MAAHVAPIHVLYMISFLDLFSVSMIVPLIPSYVKSLGGDAVFMGFIASIYGAIQMVSAPLAGILSDIFDRRLVLLVGIAGAMVGYTILGLSVTLSMVLMSRIPCGIFKHTLSTIRLTVADQTNVMTRADAMGKINAFSNFGFIFGPIVGGYLGSIPNGFNYTALLTAAVFVLNYLLVFFYVPATVKRMNVLNVQSNNGDAQSDIDPMLSDEFQSVPEHSASSVFRAVLAKINDYKEILKLSPVARNILTVRLLMASAAVLFRSHFSLMLEEKYQASSTTRGYILSYMGVVAASSGLLVGYLLKLVQSEALLVQGASVVYVLSFVAIGMSSSLNMLLFWQLPQVIAISVLRACTISMQSSAVSQESIGGILGVSDSLTALARTAGPLISGYLYVTSFSAPAFGAAILAFASSVMFYTTMLRQGVGTRKHGE